MTNITRSGNVLNDVDESNLLLSSQSTLNTVVWPNYARDFTPMAFQAYDNGGTSVATATDTKITCETVVFDTNSCYDNATNFRFTPTKAGKYFVYASLTWPSSAATALNTYIMKNGSIYANSRGAGVATIVGLGPAITAIADMNGSTDYLELWGRQNSGGTITSQGGPTVAYFGAFFLGYV